MSYIRAMLKRDKNMRPTVGFRCKLKPDSHWTDDFEPGRHMILTERKDGEFHVLVLPKGFTGELVKDITLIDDSVAWIGEGELDVVDGDLYTNMSFIDWYQNVQENECPDCGQSIITGKEKCPECGFSWE